MTHIKVDYPVHSPYNDHMRIKTNKAKCRKCDDTIISKHRHDFVRCKCGAIAVDGGTDYLKRTGGIENCIELSEYVEDDETPGFVPSNN